MDWPRAAVMGSSGSKFKGEEFTPDLGLISRREGWMSDARLLQV